MPSKAPKKKTVSKPTAKKLVPKKKKDAIKPRVSGTKKPSVAGSAKTLASKTKKPSPVKVKVKTSASSKKTASKTRELTEEQRNESLRKILILQREHIVSEAKSEIRNYITGENRQLVESALDDGDWSVIDLSEDISLMKLDRHRKTLVKIDEALRKLREGTYGTCEDCGDEIAPERLRILPFAIYCRDCQERRELLEAVEKTS